MNKVLLFIFLFNLAASAAQATESIASPQIHTKDVWQYNKLDLLSGDVVGTERFKVVEISGNQITSKIEITPKPANGSGTWLVYTDAAWNIIDNGGATFTPSNEMYKFPVSVGGKWDISYSSFRSKAGANFTCNGVGTASARESIVVPAGIYETIRLEMDFQCRSTAADASVHEQHLTAWYAPTVNRPVKTIYTRKAGGRLREKIGEELTQYAPSN